VYRAQGRQVGWITSAPLVGDLVYLDSTSAYSIVEKTARDHGSVFPVSKDALVSALDEAGLLAKKAKGHRTTTAMLCGKKRRVFCFQQSTFSDSSY
jgi:hypothetical protein